MIIGTLTTQNFEWVTLAETTTEALDNLRGAWESHAATCGAWLTWDEVESGVYLRPISLGDTLTDCALCENLAHATPCPNHGGGYDCTPFCNLCEGSQTIEREGN